MPWKTVQEDGGEWQRKWHRTRLAKLGRLSGKPSTTLCQDEIDLTICCRYAESLINNVKIRGYLGKHHPIQLSKLLSFVEEFELRCHRSDEDYESICSYISAFKTHAVRKNSKMQNNRRLKRMSRK